jgi:outer membrane lipoprotein-sorting protein
MMSQRRFPRITRWAVPAGAVALTGVVLAGFAAAGAQSAPVLPSRTTVQLLASINSASVPPAMTAVVQESASLGFPDLPAAHDPLSGLSFLTGTHTLKIWYADPAHIRLAVPVPMGETDVRRDGRNVWYWDSQTSQVTHLVLPAQAAATPKGSAVAPTPQQVARQLLAAIGPTTKVGLQQNVTIAGQAAYQISLAPKDGQSLIGQIRIAIDAKLALPLRVQIFARGAGSPAFQVGFTSLQFGTPAAANFAFTPPPGVKVKTVTGPSGQGARLSGLLPLISSDTASGSASSGVAVAPGGVIVRRVRAVRIGSAAPGKMVRAGSPSISVKLPKGAPVLFTLPARGAELQNLLRAYAGHLPKSLTAAQRKAALQRFETMITRSGAKVRVNPATGAPGLWSAYAPLSGAVPGAVAGPGAPAELGTGWLTVVVFPANGAPVPVAPRRIAAVPRASASQVAVPVPAPAGPAGQDLAMLGALLQAATPVHGSWGSGRLLTTSLLSVLVTSNGRILAGAVTPAVLYADAATFK